MESSKYLKGPSELVEILEITQKVRDPCPEVCPDNGAGLALRSRSFSYLVAAYYAA